MQDIRFEQQKYNNNYHSVVGDCILLQTHPSIHPSKTIKHLLDDKRPAQECFCEWSRNVDGLLKEQFLRVEKRRGFENGYETSSSRPGISLWLFSTCKQEEKHRQRICAKALLLRSFCAEHTPKWFTVPMMTNGYYLYGGKEFGWGTAHTGGRQMLFLWPGTKNVWTLLRLALQCDMTMLGPDVCKITDGLYGHSRYLFDTNTALDLFE